MVTVAAVEVEAPTAPSPTVFNVLGPLEVVAAESQPISIRAKRLRALLGILLLHTGRILPIERIIDGIWAERPPRSAVENVRTYVHQLRSLLRRTGEHGQLESHPGGYRLCVDPGDLDLLCFTRLSDRGRRALQDQQLAEASTLLGAALALWRGSPLSELELGHTMQAKITALEERRWQTQSDWISVRLALGDHAELVVILRELVGEQPLDEDYWCYLAAALYHSGRCGEALSTISDARETIVDELGVEPGPHLKRVQAAVLRGDESLHQALPGVQPEPVLPVLGRVGAPADDAMPVPGRLGRPYSAPDRLHREAYSV